MVYRTPIRSSNIGRVCMLLALGILLGLETPASAAVIFNNFGPGNTYNTLSGSQVSQWFGATDWDRANAFTPLGNNFSLDTIELAVGLNALNNQLDVWVLTDVNGAPGAIIEAFHFSGAMGPVGIFNPPLLANSVLHPVLTAGTPYWLGASATGPNTLAVWNFNVTGDFGFHATRANLGPWGVSQGSQRNAFRISGTPYPQPGPPVPEPGTLLLLGSGLAGVGVIGRRRRQK